MAAFDDYIPMPEPVMPSATKKVSPKLGMPKLREVDEAQSFLETKAFNAAKTTKSYYELREIVMTVERANMALCRARKAIYDAEDALAKFF